MVSGALDATGQLLEGEIDLLSGQTLASITDVTQQVIDTAKDNLRCAKCHRPASSRVDLVSGSLEVTGQFLEVEIDLLSGQTLASISDVTQQVIDTAKDTLDALNATGQLLAGEVDLVSGSLEVTGTTRKRYIRLRHLYYRCQWGSF